MDQLSRRIYPLTLFMLSINAMIGSGWLFAPMYAAKIAGPAAIFSWVICGVSSILIALTYAELSTMLPIAGGTAHIPQLSHGAFASFILSWIAWISSLIMTPIEVQAVLQYASLYYPSLIDITNGVPVFSTIGYLFAAGLMILLCVINSMSYKGLMRFNFILVIFKFSILIFTIFSILHIRFNPTNFHGLFTSTQSVDGWHSIFSAVATSGIILAFNGFKSGVELAGETRNLKVAIPLSTVGSVIGCLFLYLGLQVCFIGALDPTHFREGWSNLSFYGDVGPFVGLASILGLIFLHKLLYMNAIVSPLGAGLIYVTSSARILYAMSKIGYVPNFLSKLNKQKLPVNAIITNFFVGMLTFLPLPGWQSMVNFLVSAMVITYSMGPISLLCFRYTLTDQPRPFKLPAANVLCFLAFYSCNLFCYWTGWQTISKLSIALLLGIFFFILSIFSGKVKIKEGEIKSALWVIPYLAGLILISYFGDFEGLHYIPFGWDFIIIALFSFVILLLAVRSRLALSTEKLNKCLYNNGAVHSST